MLVAVVSDSHNNSEAVDLAKKAIAKCDALLFLGDGEFRKTVEQKAVKKGVSDRIIFMGNVSNVPKYLSAMDIFVLPSHFEGLPFSLIEAKSSGLPCLLSDKISREADLASGISFLSIESSKS